MPEASYQFFQNRECEFFPCHKVQDSLREEFNCLFCFCPLYTREDCGGTYTILSNGVKDCSKCVLPHVPKNYDYVIQKLRGGS